MIFSVLAVFSVSLPDTCSSEFEKILSFLTSDIILCSMKNSFSLALSKSLSKNSSPSISTGMLIFIVASCLLRYADSLSFSSLVLVLPFISSICSYRFSMLLYSLINLSPVFSPIPATPLILSEVSPIKALRSIN